MAGPVTGSGPRSRAVWKLWRGGGSVLAAAALLFGMLQAVTRVAHEEDTVTRIFDTAGIHAVEVRTDAGDVEVVETGAAADSIGVTARVSHGLRPTGNRMQVDGDRLELTATCPLLLSDFCHVNYLVEVPPDVDVEVFSGRGNISVAGIDGDVDLDASLGSIDATRLGGRFRLRSSHGSVTATRLTSATGHAAADHGSVRVEYTGTPRAVEARSAHGNVEIALPDDGTTYDVRDTSADHGTVVTSIGIDPDSDRKITASTSHGNVTIRYGG